MSATFVPLHLLSNYSLLYGANHIPELVAHSASLGLEAMALTDRNNLYGLHVFLDACATHGIRPVIGARLETHGEHLVCLSRNHTGFSRLTHALTALHRDTPPLEDLCSLLDGDTILLVDDPGLLRRVAGATALRDYPPQLWAGLTGPVRAMISTATELGLPLVALPEIVGLHRADYFIHRVLRAIDQNSDLARLPPKQTAHADALFPSPRALRDRFSICPEALDATLRIARQCQNDIPRGLIFPRYETPVPSADLLRRLALQGAEERYGELSETVLQRLDYELGIITEKGFADYFLVVRDIVSRASRICGRGSGAASLVAYSLGITNVDPVRHNLYFERFLNRERKDPPDIDIDFAWDERDAIIEQVMEDHGRPRCAMVCNHIHFKPRSALREVAKVHGIPDGEIAQIRKRLSGLARAEGESPFSRRFYPYKNTAHPLEAPWPEILATAARITGFPRHLGVHPGGLVITPDPLYNHVPVETAPKGVPIITWEKDGAEEAGFVKIDLLGNRSLAVVRDAIANVKANGLPFDQRTWDPLCDPATIDLLASGRSMGVFYVESPAMRQLQRKTRRGDFEHLVIHSSIIRPAANRFITKYVERLRGAPYDPLHPLLDRLLSETYGIMCYQEDVSKVAIALAGFTSGEGDALRKVLSKKNRETLLPAYQDRFFRGAAAKGVAGPVIEEIWRMILSFDGYSFCKPHSASFAMVSFQSAYLKAHYPAEFMAAVISNRGGFYTALAYISEAQRLGLTPLPPDVNRSELAYTGQDRTLRVGLMAIANLRAATVDRLLSQRRDGGPFTSLDDFGQRVEPTASDLEALVGAGALDGIAGGRSRPQQLWHGLLQRPEQPRRRQASMDDLFERPDPVMPQVHAPTREERQRSMFAQLGFLCEGHPLQFYDTWIRRIPRLVPATDIPLHAGAEVRVVGWPVTRKTILTRSGDPMQFVSFEDRSAIFETVLFPEINEKYGDAVGELHPFLITGTVQEEQGAIYVVVTRVRKIPLSPLPDQS